MISHDKQYKYGKDDWYDLDDKDDKDDKDDENYKGDKGDRNDKCYMEYKDEFCIDDTNVKDNKDDNNVDNDNDDNVDEYMMLMSILWNVIVTKQINQVMSMITNLTFEALFAHWNKGRTKFSREI